MSEAQAIGSATPVNRTLKFTAFLFGAVAYLTFLFTILYAIGFVSDLVVPKAIDTGTKSPIFEALAVNLALMSLFAVQHSVMARKGLNNGGRNLFRSRLSVAPMCCAQAWHCFCCSGSGVRCRP